MPKSQIGADEIDKSAVMLVHAATQGQNASGGHVCNAGYVRSGGSAARSQDTLQAHRRPGETVVSELRPLHVVGRYDFAGAEEILARLAPWAVEEIELALTYANGEEVRTTVSQEKTKIGRRIVSPKTVNAILKVELVKRGWEPERSLSCGRHGHRVDIDFAKGVVGVEVQLGKYFAVYYDIHNKMPIFAQRTALEVGIEVIPMSAMARQMSSGVPTFESVRAHLAERGTYPHDIPVLVLGIAP